jgi:hypothetical protein
MIGMPSQRVVAHVRVDMSARQRLSRLCYVEVMARISSGKHVRTALFPLVLLAIVVSGILPTHQAAADFVGSSTASVHSSHHVAGTSALDPVMSGLDPSAGSADANDPTPMCHPVDDPVSISPNRCTSRDHDDGKPGPVADRFPATSCADPPVQHRSAETDPWWHPHGSDLLSVLCVLRT